MPAGEEYVVYVDDAEDGKPNSSCFGEEVVILIAPLEANKLNEVVELLVPVPWCLLRYVQALLEYTD